MKEKLSFVLTNNYTDHEDMVRVLGCIENVEHEFKIEFAAGVEYDGENKKLLFASDYLFTDKEDEFLDKYDGMVVEQYFRDKNTQKVYDLNEAGCRLDIMYDSDYRYNGTEQFSNPKIVTKGFSYGTKSKKNKM